MATRYSPGSDYIVCNRGQQKGKAISKQRMAQWIMDTITLAYEAEGETPLGVSHRSGRSLVVRRWQTFVELRVGRLPTRSLGSIAYMSNQFPPVFSPQKGSDTERTCSELACGVLKRLILQRVP